MIQKRVWGRLACLLTLLSTFSIEAQITEVAKIRPLDPQPGSFGYAVAIDGDSIAIGAGWTSDHGNISGSVYVFERDEGGPDAWGQTAKLTASDATAGDNFGYSVAIENDTMVVGAINDDDLGGDAGAAYVFRRDIAGDWNEVEKLHAFDGAGLDRFGIFTAIDGDRLAVGAHQNSVNGIRGGAVYIFERASQEANEWELVAKVHAADPGPVDAFGRAVALEAGTLAVGAYLDDTSAGVNSGSAFVFERDAGGQATWGQVAHIIPADAATEDRFAFFASMNNNLLVAGSHWADTGEQDTGSAYLYGRNQGGPGAWGQVAKLVAEDATTGDNFGISVSISGEYVVVGALRDDDLGTSAGSAYLFGRSQGGVDSWGQISKITASDGDAEDFFGWALAIDGNTVVVGARGFEGNFGAAYVFEITPANQDPIADAGLDQNVAADGTCFGPVTLDGSGSNDPDGDPLTHSWLASGVSLSGEVVSTELPIGNWNVLLTVDDNRGGTAEDSVDVEVSDQTSPSVLLEGAAIMSLECGEDYVDPGVVVSDNCDPSPEVEIGGDIVDTSQPGTYTLTYQGSDSAGNTAIPAVRVVAVEDTEPPIVTLASADPSRLWPPNHKMVVVTILSAASDTCDSSPVCAIAAVASNEPETGPNYGNTSPDWEIVGSEQVRLRAERSGTGDGRVYTVTIACTDISGGLSTAEVEVVVPKGKNS